MRITRVFINVDMRNGHQGLSELCRENRIKTNELKPGDFVVFINADRTKMKLYGANDVLSYVSRNTKINLDAVKYFPLAFKARGRFDYDEALRMAVDKALYKGQRKTLEIY